MHFSHLSNLTKTYGGDVSVWINGFKVCGINAFQRESDDPQQSFSLIFNSMRETNSHNVSRTIHVDWFVYKFWKIWIYMTVEILSDISLTKILLLLTLNEARGTDCEDFSVIHPSCSTSQSVTNTLADTLGALLSINSLWAISGTSPKVKSVIQHFPTRGSLPTCAIHVRNSWVNISLSHAGQ